MGFPHGSATQNNTKQEKKKTMRSKLSNTLSVLLLICVLAVVQYVLPNTVPSTKTPVTLISVVDGDTIKVQLDNEEVTVRYLLIDTPETKKPGESVQPFGQEANDYNRELLSRGQIYLEFDPLESQTDRYGRLLAYVWVDDTLVQSELVRAGLARVGYMYKDRHGAAIEAEALHALAPYAYQHDFKYTHAKKLLDMQELARSEKQHIWEKDGYVVYNKNQNGGISEKYDPSVWGE